MFVQYYGYDPLIVVFCSALGTYNLLFLTRIRSNLLDDKCAFCVQ